MITIVVNLLNLLIFVIQSVTLSASFLGQLIISVVEGILSFIFQIIQSIIVFIKIVYEDNVFIFTEDLPNFTNSVIVTATDQWLSLHNLFNKTVHDLGQKVFLVASSLKWSVNSVTFILIEIVTLLKNALLLIGNTVLFIILFVPIHLVEIFKLGTQMINKYLNVKVQEINFLLAHVKNFLTEVPLQSVVGVTTGIVIVYLSLIFKESILLYFTQWYYSLSHNLLYCYYSVYNYFIDPEVREITLMSTNGVRVGELSSSEVEDNVGTDSLCVICQERQKCILTLPCRHVCLCSECCLRLYNYQRTCPMCRTFIYHSVTIYL